MPMATLAPIVMIGCAEKRRLVSEYEAATSLFSEAVTLLHQRMGTSAKEEFERLNHIANEARVRSERARLAVEEHASSHNC